MSDKAFDELFKKLIKIDIRYHDVIFNLLKDIEPKSYLPEQDFSKNFIKIKKKKKMTYSKISAELAKAEIPVDENTLKNYGRKSKNIKSSALSKEIAKVMGVSESMLLFGEDYITVQSHAYSDIVGIFEALSKPHKTAILNLMYNIIYINTHIDDEWEYYYLEEEKDDDDTIKY